MGYSFLRIPFKEQLQQLHKKGFLYLIRYRSAKNDVVSIYYNGANIGYGSVSVVGKIVKKDGKVYVKDDIGDLIPVEDFYVFSGLDKEAWMKYVKNKVASNASRMFLVKLTLIRTYYPFHKALHDEL